MNKKIFVIRGLLRLAMGWTFFWAFLDKLFGLGFSTAAKDAWISGGSPTAGFLKFATTGPFSNFYHMLAGNPIIDWLFMLGLLAVGLCLMLGVAVRFASVVGIAMLALMYSALLLPTTNPFLDEHLVYILVMLALYFGESGEFFGLGKWWKNWIFAKRFYICGNAEKVLSPESVVK
jgi:thiosulfate dehydrogenase [quinone] large subunit